LNPNLRNGVNSVAHLVFVQIAEKNHFLTSSRVAPSLISLIASFMAMTRSARKFVVTVSITFGRLARCGRRLSGSRHRRYDKSGFSDGSCRLFRDGSIGLYVTIPFSFAALLTGFS